MTVDHLIVVIVALLAAMFSMFNARQKRIDDKVDYLCKMMPAQTAKIASVDHRVSEIAGVVAAHEVRIKAVEPKATA